MILDAFLLLRYKLLYVLKNDARDDLEHYLVRTGPGISGTEPADPIKVPVTRS